MTKIKDIKELSKLAKNGVDCFVQLNYGLRASKYIISNGKEFEVLNEVDGSTESFDRRSIKRSIIGEALTKGALYVY
jgi:hypothetical protein